MPSAATTFDPLTIVPNGAASQSGVAARPVAELYAP